MAPLRGPVLLILLCLCCMLKTSLSSQCQEPEWDDNLGVNPLAARRGKVVLVALLKGYCRYCVRQADRLHQLKTYLMADGYPDIDMVIINGGGPMSRNLISNLVNASPIHVVQDTPNHHMYRQVFRAYKDDFLVYDRCGQAAIYIPHPYSNLDYNITRDVLKAVHLGRHSCYCSLDYRPRNVNTDDVMMGDDPGVSDDERPSTPYVNEDIIQCNSEDATCRQFLRVTSHAQRRGPQNMGWGGAAVAGYHSFSSVSHNNIRPRRPWSQPGGSGRRDSDGVGTDGVLPEVAGISEHVNERVSNSAHDSVPVAGLGTAVMEESLENSRSDGSYRVGVNMNAPGAGSGNRRRGGGGGSRRLHGGRMGHYRISGGAGRRPHHRRREFAWRRMAT